MSPPSPPKKLATAAEIKALIHGRISASEGCCTACRVSTPRPLPAQSHRYHGANWIIDRIERFQPGCEPFVLREVAKTMYEYDCSDWESTVEAGQQVCRAARGS